MNRLVAIALTLLAGCGGPLPTGTLYVSPSGQPLAPNPPGVAAGTPDYLIDGSAGANIPLDSYGITTNGGTWYLEWQSAETPHRFTGDIYCPAGCSLDFITFGGKPAGASYNSITANHFHFDALAAASTHQHLEFDATRQPVTLDLSIDGKAAINPATTFPSSGKLATTDRMPFGLVSSNAEVAGK